VSPLRGKGKRDARVFPRGRISSGAPQPSRSPSRPSDRSRWAPANRRWQGEGGTDIKVERRGGAAHSTAAAGEQKGGCAISLLSPSLSFLPRHSTRSRQSYGIGHPREDSELSSAIIAGDHRSSSNPPVPRHERARASSTSARSELGDGYYLGSDKHVDRRLI
jgi:hypothetical protein